MKNKIIRIEVARYVDNTVITFHRANGSYAVHESDTFIHAMSEDSVQRFYDTFRPLLKAGTWKAIDLGEYGAWATGLTVIFELVKPQESFEVTSVSREDLDRLGFDTSAVSDETMYKIANKLSENWMSNDDLYDGLEYLGTKFEIPRPNPKSIYDDEK